MRFIFNARQGNGADLMSASGDNPGVKDLGHNARSSWLEARPTLFIRALALLLICFATSTAMGAVKTKARLILPVETAKPGETVLAGIQLKMPEHWHTYWRNPGEAGGATEVKWTLPEGITAGAIQWPVPQKFDFQGLVTYVYHDEIILLVPLTLASNANPGLAELKAKVSWIECELECVKGGGSVSGTLTIGSESKPSADADKIEEAKKSLPKSSAELEPLLSWEKEATGNSRPLIVEWKSNAVATNTDFFAYENKNFDVMPAVEVLSADNGKIRLRKEVKKFKGEWPAAEAIPGLLVENVSDPLPTAFEVAPPGFNSGESKPNEASATSGSAQPDQTPAATPDAPAPPSLASESLLKMLLYAFLGGMILNVMPCVLPVIALKIFGFVQQSKEAPKRVFQLGLVYALGVLFSFAVFAGMVIAVKSAGNTATWGMQMQNPYFRMGLTILMTLVALNLFGIFEVILSGRATGAASELASKEGFPGAFFNGMLAVLLATPCTAPLLAPAVGYAFTQSAGIITLFFLTIGAGLAFPYVLLCWQPGWLQYLPKPGAWMEKFKIALGFPVLATAIWLFGLTVPSFSDDASWGFGFFLVTLALALWIWGQFIQRGSKRKGLAVGLALLTLALGYGYGLEDRMEWRKPGQKKVQDTWSHQAIEEARSDGKIVVVDFTAEWCLTCKVGERIIKSETVQAKMKELNAILLIADDTNPRSDIAAELEKFGRSAVPLVLVYPRDTSKQPIILPPLFTSGMFMEALEKAAK